MNKYRASIATAVLGAVTLTHAQSMSRSSFSSSMIASAMSKFHGVKAPSRTQAAAPTQAQTAVFQPKQDLPIVASQTVAKAPIAVAPPVVVAVVSAPKVVPAVTKRVAAVTSTTVAVATPKPDPKIERAPTDEEIEHAFREAVIAGPMIDPNSIELEMPAVPPAIIDPEDSQTPPAKKLKLRWVSEGYFDAGYERLLGTFSTQIIRYGVRYGQNDLHAYFRNETLNTNGTGLPYPQAVTGTSVGVEARHWFPGDKMYASMSMGYGIGGYNVDKPDFRYGLIGYTSWAHDRWFSDFYGELFYIALAADTFLDFRIRSGQIFKRDKRGYWWHYVVGQFWVSGQTESGTENRAEAGLGVGYVFQQSISLNMELRGGYAFRSGIDDGGDRLYFNPTIILSGGWYKGFFY